MVRAQQFINERVSKKEVDDGEQSPPDPINNVVFENVEFAYDTEQVLDSIFFAVESDEFVAFAGPSGTGKSTIVSLLARMYEPDLGQILASGTPIEELVLNEWRDRLSVVRQDSYIFNESLRYNITLGSRNADDEEILEACEIAQVTDLLYGLHRGLDTSLGDDGIRLSGGQRQRVALARALLKDADLLILDEAMSDLDSNIEETVHRALENMDRNYTILVVAHRLSTVVNADRIYTVADGEIEEQGCTADRPERNVCRFVRDADEK